MDPLSVSAAIAGFIQLAGISVDYVNTVVNAPKDRKALLERCNRLKDDLQNIKTRIDEAHGAEVNISQGPFGRKTQNDRIFNRYRAAIKSGGKVEALQDKLDGLFDNEFKKQASRRRELGRRFVWTWKKENLKPKFDEVIALTNELRAFLQDDDSQIGHETLAGILKIQNANEESQTIQILNWISNPDQDAADVIGSNSNILPIQNPFVSASPIYQQWIADADSEHWHLNCYGKPGCGKSYRARAVISDLSVRFGDRGEDAVLCIRFNHMNASQQTLTKVYRQLLRQLISQSPGVVIPDSVRDLWNTRRLDGYSGLTESEARDLFISELKSHRKTFIVVDALDEAGPCADSIHSELSALRKAGACIFSTTRESPQAVFEAIHCNGCGPVTNGLYWQCNICIASLGLKFDLCQKCYQNKNMRCNDSTHTMHIPSKLNVEVSPSAAEIEKFVSASLKRELDLDATGDDDETLYESFSPNLKTIQRALGSRWDSVPSQLSVAAGDSYLVADLLIRRLQAQATVDGALKILDNLSNGENARYDDQYTDMLELCLNTGDREGRKVAYDHLAMMSCAQTTLSFKQLSHAVAVRYHDKSEMDFGRRCCTKRTVRRETHGLLSIGDFGNPNAFTVTFFHQTLRSYLEQNNDQWFKDVHQKMFDACVAYLQLDAFKQPFASPKELVNALVEYPFAAYAAMFWGAHLRNTKAPKENVVSVLELINSPKRKKTITQIARHVYSRAELAWDVPGDVGPLHICAFQGLPEICRILIEDGEDVNYGEDTHGQTPLHYACRRGHNEVVKMLLDAHADPNIASGTGRTPLMETIETDRIETLELLLTYKSVNVNAEGKPPRSTTALIQAAQAGKAQFVAKLLEHEDILVNKADAYNITALSWATRFPSEECVGILLCYPGIDLSIRDDRTGTAVDSLGNGYLPYLDDTVESIAQLFLQHPDAPKLGPGMQYLIEDQRNDLMEMFLNKQSYTSWRDEHERTLLHIAAVTGNGEALRMVQDHLVAAQTSYVEMSDNHGQTPLHAACSDFWRDEGDAAQFLLEQGALPFSQDSYGKTALEVAFANSKPSQYDEIRNLFDAYVPAGLSNTFRPPNPSIENLLAFGSTQELQAAISNLSSPLSLIKDPYTGWTALHMTMCKFSPPRPEKLKILLPKALTYLDSTDNSKQTCLHKAAERECVDGAKALIDAGADLNIKDKWGDTAFELARRCPDQTCSLLLITAGAKVSKTSIDPDLIHRAVVAGNIEAVRRLIEIGVDIHFRERGTGPTPLILATDLQRIEIDNNKTDLYKHRWKDFLDKSSLVRTAKESPKAKAFQQIVDLLQDEESRGQRRPSTFRHRDLTPLIRRLRQDNERQSRSSLSPPQNYVPGASPPPPYERTVDEDDDSRPQPSHASSQVPMEGLGITGHFGKETLNTSKATSNLGENERIALIVVGGIVLISWMWLLLHYLSQSPGVIHEL